jgi:hypothetical protein
VLGQEAAVGVLAKVDPLFRTGRRQTLLIRAAELLLPPLRHTPGPNSAFDRVHDP